MTELREHPDFEQLLQLLDPEMSSGSSRAVEKHVAECWQCRAQVDEIQSTVHDFARYHQKVLLPNLPAPPAAWPDLRPAMMRIDAAEVAAPWFKGPWLKRIGSIARWTLAGGAVALAVTMSLRTASVPKKVLSPVVKEIRPAAVEPVAPKPLPGAATVLPRPVSVSDNEVQVFWALHRMGADLGDPVSVTLDDGIVNVSGVGLGTDREAEIREALASIPGVRMNFEEGETARAEAPSKRVSVVAGRSPFEEKLLRWAGGQDGWERYANRVLDESDAILARSHALQTLAREFPAARRAELDDSAAAQLSEIADSHRAALDRHIAAIETLLAPVQEALNAPVAVTPPGGRDLLAAAQRMDRVVSVLFGGAATELTPAQLLAELSNASALLKGAQKAE